MYTNLNPAQNTIPNPLTYFSYHLIFKPSNVEGIWIDVDNDYRSQVDERGLQIRCIVTIDFVSQCGGSIRTERSKRYDMNGSHGLHYEDRSGQTSLKTSGRRQVRMEEAEEIFSFDSLVFTPKVLFYLAHAQSVVVPFNKRYKEVIANAFSRLGISPHWRKGSQYYKAIMNTNENQQCKIICLEDVLSVQEIQDGNVSQSHGAIRNFKNQITKIKKANAYRYCIDIFKTKLMPKLLETSQNQVRSKYEKIMKEIEKIYHRTSLTFDDTISEFHTRAHSKNSLQTDSNEENSLKDLKQQIRQLLTEQKVTGPPSTEIDEQCKQLVYDSIRQLFITSYEQIINERKSIERTNTQIYHNVIEEMRKHIQLNYKCLFLFDILLEHMDQQDKVIQISRIMQETSKKQEDSNLDLLLTFQKSSMDDLLISQSSLSTDVKKIEDKPAVGETFQHNLQIEKLNNHIKYLQELLKSKSISFFSMGKGLGESKVDSFVFEASGAPKIQEQIRNHKNDSKYLSNKIQELKNESNSAKKLQPFSKSKQNAKKVEQSKFLKIKQQNGLKKSFSSKQSGNSSHSTSLKSITPRNSKNATEQTKTTNSLNRGHIFCPNQWRI